LSGVPTIVLWHHWSSKPSAAQTRLAVAGINGATPEQAVDQVQVHYYNTRATFKRMRSGKKP
jgi:hypothetical protein